MTTTDRRDLALILGLFVIDLILVFIFGNPWRYTPTAAAFPPAAYIPVILGLAVVFQRLDERIESRKILIPLILLSLFLFICLLIQFPRFGWALMIPNRMPAALRTAWVWLLIAGWHPAASDQLLNLWDRTRTWIRERGLLGRYYPVLAVILLLLAWHFRSMNISPDGYDWAKSCKEPGHWWEEMREPLTILFYRWSYLIFGVDRGWALVTCVGLVSGLAGVAVAPLVIQSLRRFLPDSAMRGWVYLMLLSSGGFVLIFINHVEVYALLVLGFWAFMAAAAFYYEGHCGLWVVGLVYGAVFGLHISIVFWAPALLALPWLLGPHEMPSQTKTLEIIKAICAASIVPNLLGSAILFVGWGGDIQAMLAFFWGDKVMTVGTDGAMFRPLSDYANFETYLAYINFTVFLMPALPILLVFLITRKTWLNTNKESDQRLRLWSLLLFVPYLLYFITWRPDKHPNVDWDLFTGIVSPLVLVLGMRIIPRGGPQGAYRLVLAQAIWWGLLFVVLQIVYQHYIKIMDWPIPV